jgi:hypothetical protein
MPAVKSSRANLPVTTDRDPHEVHRMKVLDLLQWPAMLVTVAAAWFVASGKRPRRRRRCAECPTRATLRNTS